MSGVPGGGRISENSDARVKIGECVGERATIRLVPALRAATRDCGVMSWEKATESQERNDERRRYLTFGVRGEEDDVVEGWNVVFDDRWRVGFGSTEG